MQYVNMILYLIDEKFIGEVMKFPLMKKTNS